MKMWQLLAIISCLTFVRCDDVYKIPTPTFDPYKPRGLKLTIPDEAGIELVVFHVNINREIESKEGEYTKYIVSPSDDEWVYTNEVLRLRLLDKVYVRITVIKDGEQYVRVFDPFVVRELKRLVANSSTTSPTISPTLRTSTTTRYEPITTPRPSIPLPSQSGNCQSVLQNVTRITLDLEEKLQESNENIEALKHLLPGPYFVKIGGSITQAYDNPYDVVNVALKNMLQVKKLSYKTCVRTGEFIVCELSGIDDKVEIVKCAKKHPVQSSQIRIIY